MWVVGSTRGFVWLWVVMRVLHTDRLQFVDDQFVRSDNESFVKFAKAYVFGFRAFAVCVCRAFAVDLISCLRAGSLSYPLPPSLPPLPH